MHLCLTRNENKKRWRSRNSQAFHYTPANKPTEDLENRHHQPVQAQPETGAKVEPELKDDLEMEPLEIKVYSQETNAPPEAEAESSQLTS